MFSCIFTVLALLKQQSTCHSTLIHYPIFEPTSNCFYSLIFMFVLSIMRLYVLSPLRFPHKNDSIFGLSLPPVVCRRVHVLFTLFVLVCVCGVKHILCCVCALFFFVMCTLCCQIFWIFLF